MRPRRCGIARHGREQVQTNSACEGGQSGSLPNGNKAPMTPHQATDLLSAAKVAASACLFSSIDIFSCSQGLARGAGPCKRKQVEDGRPTYSPRLQVMTPGTQKRLLYSAGGPAQWPHLPAFAPKGYQCLTNICHTVNTKGEQEEPMTDQPRRKPGRPPKNVIKRIPASPRKSPAPCSAWRGRSAPRRKLWYKDRQGCHSCLLVDREGIEPSAVGLKASAVARTRPTDL